MALYHDTTDLERVKREDPGSLFAAADGETVEGWGRIWWFLSEFEFGEIVKGTMGCLEGYRGMVGRCALGETFEGENHVSYVYGIGLEGNRAGQRLLEIVRG